ncbi:hypothetical protein KXR64_22775 [Brucella intermedia]|uniref:hypothetical protein n=1 Tax=Brucella TaxID=234 RepID=UPI0009466401|nr:hypothetical protein [Brucella intermedia]
MNFQFCGETRSLVGEITEAFLPYAEAAVLRLQSLHPDAGFSLDGDKLTVRGIDGKSVSIIRSAIAHQIYREKILVETLSLRKSLLSAVIK